MQVYTKKYGNDSIRAYKSLIRKLNRENFYEELKEKEYFKSKGQKRREEKKRNIARVMRKRHKTNMLLLKSENKKFSSNKQKN